jgi:PhnB protein
MKLAHPYLYFDGDAEAAFEFYRSVFGGEIPGIVRFRDFPGNPMGVPEAELDKVAHVALPLGPVTMLMGTDVVTGMPEPLRAGNNVAILIEPETAEEADRLFAALSAGGRVDRPLQRTEWAQKHGGCTDAFGVQWLVDYTGDLEVPEADLEQVQP